MEPRGKVSFQRISKYIRPYLGRALGILALVTLGIFLGMIQPLATKFLIDDVLLGGSIRILHILIIAMLVLIVVRSVVGLAYHYLYIRMGQFIMVDIRRQLYSHLLRLQMQEIRRRPAGDIMSRILSDVGALQNVLTTFVLSLVTNSLMLVVAAFILLALDWQLALIGFIALPAFVAITRYFARPVREASFQVQRELAGLSSFLQESIQAFLLVRSLSREAYRIRRFDDSLAGHTRAVLTSGMISAWASQLVLAVGSTGPIILMWVGSYRVINGQMSPGTLIAFFTYLSQMYGPLSSLTQLNVSVQGSLAAVERIFGFLDLEADHSDSSASIELPQVTGHVEFKDVSFGYGSRPVLSNVNLEFKPGTITALVGPSGAGKSTIASLLLKLYQPTDGTITVDGIDVSSIKSSSLRNHITVLSQEVFLFNDTILENIRFGRPEADMEQVQAAAAAANAHEFISNLSDGYQTRIGERGETLSGGERQKIALARAMLRDPAILVLDEATSSMDTLSEDSVWEALHRLIRERTTIVITHRPSTFDRADQVVVVEDGRVVDVGSHDQLLSRCELYSNLHGSGVTRGGARR